MRYGEAHAPCLERKKKRHSLETIMSPVYKIPLRKNKRVRGGTIRESHARAIKM
jgi:hypothetical protein